METRIVFIVDEEHQFESKADALKYLRRKHVKVALTQITGSNDQWLNWLLENREVVQAAFDANKARRSAKDQHAGRKSAERAQQAGQDAQRPPFFRYFLSKVSPSVQGRMQRLRRAEPSPTARTRLATAGCNEELINWILTNRDAVSAAYEADPYRELGPL